MGGPSKSLQNEQISMAREDSAMKRDLFNESKANTQRMYDLQAPAISFNKAMASGDRGTMLQAAAPAIGDITRATQQTKQDIMATMPPGVARDFALSKVEREAPMQTSNFLRNLYLSSFDKLANIGSGLGAFSLQQLGGGLRAGEDSQNSINSVQQQKAQKKATTMGFLGQLAGAAGTAAGGGAFG